MASDPLAPFGSGPRQPTQEELDRDKRTADRRILLDHVDWMLRPPVWVYEEIEQAIAQVNEGSAETRIQSNDGRSYTASELIDRWEIEEDILEAYSRSADHESYRDGY